MFVLFSIFFFFFFSSSNNTQRDQIPEIHQRRRRRPQNKIHKLRINDYYARRGKERKAQESHEPTTHQPRVKAASASVSADAGEVKFIPLRIRQPFIHHPPLVRIPLLLLRLLSSVEAPPSAYHCLPPTTTATSTSLRFLLLLLGVVVHSPLVVLLILQSPVQCASSSSSSCSYLHARNSCPHFYSSPLVVLLCVYVARKGNISLLCPPTPNLTLISSQSHPPGRVVVVVLIPNLLHRS